MTAKPNWRLSRKQLDVVQAIQNGGYIWIAAEQPYLATKSGEQFNSRPLHGKIFTALVEHGIIAKSKDNPKKYVLA